MTLPERDLCLRCLRARRVCFCEELLGKEIAPSFRIVILQHPRERRNSIGSARLAHLCLKDSLLLGGTSFDEDPRIQALLSDPTRKSWLVFPGSDALNLSVSVDEQRAEVQSGTVFVIDGTWATARTLLRKNPKIGALPRISFNPSTPSAYRVRKQPHPHCLSTLEAIHELIRILNPEADPSILLQSFEKMVDQQVHFGGREKRLREILSPAS